MRFENGILKVVANRFLSDKKIKEIIEENIDWINAHKTSVKEEPKPQIEKAKNDDKERCCPQSKDSQGQLVQDMFAARQTLILGDPVNIASCSSGCSYLDGKTLYISEKFYANRDSRLKAVKSFLKKLAASGVADEVADFGSKTAMCPVKIEFRENNGSWVKCSLANQRILCFDFRIVQLPQQLRKYVIVHAFAHFSHPLHDCGFWKFVSEFLPDYRILASELDEYKILKDI